MTNTGEQGYTSRMADGVRRENETVGLSLSEKRDPLAVLVRICPKDGPVRKERLSSGETVIGAGSESDLILTDGAVSRRHLSVRAVAEGVQVKDLGSRNGSYYLGQKFSEMTLALGCRVQVGETELEFVADQKDFEGTEGSITKEYGGLVGRSAPMQRLFTLMKRLEGSLVNVLIEGESGTGKELIARALHEGSQVKDGPFIALNCGALDRALVRSELFGHKKGAFTGAQSEGEGAFAAADGGTLFLDEIGELPLDIQPVLLRVLETGTYTRVGESRARPVRVRIIAATHRSLKEDAQEGLFRSDLYFRLMVVALHAPSLRERPEDIPILAQTFAHREGLGELGSELLEQLKKRSFPGNVRELKHALLAYRAIGELPTGDVGRATSLDSALEAFLDPTRGYAEQKEALIDRMTELYLARLIVSTEGNRSEAARVAGLQRGYLRRLLEKYGLD